MEGLLNYIQLAAQSVGDENLFCALLAVVVLLFFKRVLLFPNYVSAVIMFLPCAFFLFDHPYKEVTANYTPQIIIPLLWLTEVSIMTALKMLGGVLAGVNPFKSKISFCLVIASLAFIAASIWKPALMEEYLPGVEKNVIYFAACGIPLLIATWASLKAFLPLCIWAGAIAFGSLYIVDNKEIADTVNNIKINIDQENVAKLYQDGKQQIVSLAMDNYKNF